MAFDLSIFQDWKSVEKTKQRLEIFCVSRLFPHLVFFYRKLRIQWKYTTFILQERLGVNLCNRKTLRPLGVAMGNAISATHVWSIHTKTQLVGRRQPMTSLYHSIKGRRENTSVWAVWYSCFGVKRVKPISISVRGASLREWLMIEQVTYSGRRPSHRNW